MESVKAQINNLIEVSKKYTAPLYNKHLNRRFDAENFYISTRAIFQKVPIPERAPDYISESGSKYFFSKTGVTRVSNHWGMGIATCDWYLGSRDNFNDNFKIPVAGFCAFVDFKNSDKYNIESLVWRNLHEKIGKYKIYTKKGIRLLRQSEKQAILLASYKGN